MRKMYFAVKQIIDIEKPDFVVIEAVQYQKNMRVFSQLSQLQGVLFSLFFELDIGFTIIEATAWKSFCKISGQKREEQKANTIQMVKDTYGIEVTEDEADAIGIGRWAVNNILKEVE